MGVSRHLPSIVEKQWSIPRWKKRVCSAHGRDSKYPQYLEGKFSLDLLMVRDRETGRFLYTEQMERRSGETPWAYVRRSVRREAQMRENYPEDHTQVIVGWGVGSVDDFLKSYPEYRFSRDQQIDPAS